MVTSTSTFRLTDDDRRQLDRLADELQLSRTDVVRYGLAALRRDDRLRKEIHTEQRAIAFLDRVRKRYGKRAQLRLVVGPDAPDARPRIASPRVADEPLDYGEVDVRVRYEGDHAFIDLVDPTVGVGIRNAYWIEVHEAKDLFIPLNAIGLYRRLIPTEEPRTHRLDNGRTVVALTQDDGSVTQFVLDAKGNSRLLPAEQRAEWFWNGDLETTQATP